MSKKSEQQARGEARRQAAAEKLRAQLAAREEADKARAEKSYDANVKKLETATARHASLGAEIETLRTVVAEQARLLGKEAPNEAQALQDSMVSPQEASEKGKASKA